MVSIVREEPVSKRQTLYASFLLLFLHLTQASLAGSGLEERGMWVVRWSITSPGEIRRVVEQAQEANLDFLLVQAYARGEALYRSELVPRATELAGTPPSFDPFGTILDLAHRRGLRVHAWVNIFYAWSHAPFPGSPRHHTSWHRDWFIADRDGRSLLTYSVPQLKSVGLEGYFLSPANPKVRVWLRGICAEICRKYPVDGVHLDYVRYPQGDYGYDPPSRAQFMRRYYVDPLDLVQNRRSIRSTFGENGYTDLRRRWNMFRADAVSSLVKEIAFDMKRIRPGISVSAAVSANPEHARGDLHQDWLNWFGDLDFVVPMCYSKSTGFVVKTYSKLLPWVREGKVLVGLGVYNQPYYSCEEKIEKLRDMGARGFVLFSYDGIKDDPEYFRKLGRGVFRRGKLFIR